MNGRDQTYTETRDHTACLPISEYHSHQMKKSDTINKTIQIRGERMKTIGFIGMGTMGLPMAKRLLDKGYPVTVYNRTPGKMDELVKLGADIAETPADTAKSCHVLITMLSNDEAFKEVFYGPNGITHGLHPELTFIDCSTT